MTKPHLWLSSNSSKISTNTRMDKVQNEKSKKLFIIKIANFMMYPMYGGNIN